MQSIEQLTQTEHNGRESTSTPSTDTTKPANSKHFADYQKTETTTCLRMSLATFMMVSAGDWTPHERLAAESNKKMAKARHQCCKATGERAHPHLPYGHCTCSTINSMSKQYALRVTVTW